MGVTNVANVRLRRNGFPDATYCACCQVGFMDSLFFASVRIVDRTAGEDVDGRDKSGHDGILQPAVALPVGLRGPFRKRRERVVA
jgi:hypothetical protein